MEQVQEAVQEDQEMVEDKAEEELVEKELERKQAEEEETVKMGQRPECAIKGCKNGALIAYGGKWICGECYYKIFLKEQERKNKLMEELEI